MQKAENRQPIAQGQGGPRASGALLSIRRSATSLPIYCSKSPTSRALFGATRDISDWEAPNALRPRMNKAVAVLHKALIHPPPNNGYNHTVRRVLSFMLLLVFSLPLISPVLALAASSEANLPACCRRNGAHHCTSITRPPQLPGSGLSFSSIPQRCPACPAAVAPAQHHDLSFQAASLIFAEIVSHPSLKFQTEARARVALDISRQKRGPPKDLL